MTQPLTPAQRLFVALQYGLPQHALSAAMFRLTRLRLGMVTTQAIRLFARRFDVDLQEAANPSPAAYPSVNAFFTRALRDDARPLDPTESALLSPVDGAVSQLGRIQDGTLFQAKGQDYSTTELLGGDARLAAEFDAGLFATLYLSPRDYHRIHMPIAGRLRQTIHVPGRLFSVNPTTTRGVPRLFARNERVVCIFDTPAGPMAMVLVGAIFVGSIETVWGGRITPPRGRRITRVVASPDQPVALERGEEMGRFNMGSTVILLLPDGSADWTRELGAGSPVRVGRALGHLRD
ncbi:archaetidylserine decarboxylase [Thiohalocapsa marina]|uniref:archaetidylserine decarboxylase n=1 Tax=Thiohalocapsa marina TaxID=424902 RepID=UPI001FEA32C8|nr:archaetidylserine decarboxylase [Thiohalocapsa marina]